MINLTRLAWVGTIADEGTGFVLPLIAVCDRAKTSGTSGTMLQGRIL